MVRSRPLSLQFYQPPYHIRLHVQAEYRNGKGKAMNPCFRKSSKKVTEKCLTFLIN